MGILVSLQNLSILYVLTKSEIWESYLTIYPAHTLHLISYESQNPEKSYQSIHATIPIQASEIASITSVSLTELSSWPPNSIPTLQSKWAAWFSKKAFKRFLTSCLLSVQSHFCLLLPRSLLILCPPASSPNFIFQACQTSVSSQHRSYTFSLRIFLLNQSAKLLVWNFTLHSLIPNSAPHTICLNFSCISLNFSD